MGPRKKAQVAFASAVLLLLLSGLAAYIAIDRLLVSEKWVNHSLEVRAALGDIDSAYVKAGRARSGYLISGNSDFLTQFEEAVPEIPRRLSRLSDLIRDNRTQRDLCSRLKVVTESRVDLLRASIDLKKRAPQDTESQADFDRRGVPLSSEMTSLNDQMRAQEDRLLAGREHTTHRLFVLTVVILAVAFILALELLAVHYRLLSTELNAREQAEQNARASEDSLRHLTGRLLQLQDIERRKFSRELHDSLGQYLVGVKMNLELFAKQRKDAFLAEAIQLLDQSISETRTISHLLHPPLLDEAGLASAATWYLEGFAQRSGIEVKLQLPDDVARLPKPLALGLFRVLQESLTNIHRHSNSSKADVALELSRDYAILTVRDYGKGIAPALLDTFRATGTNSGVGLAGMRERIRDLGGQLIIQTCTPGTLISVTLPIEQRERDARLAAAD
jgi:signal transduction histidine kinase